MHTIFDGNFRGISIIGARVLLALFLMVAVYQGRRWAKTTLLVLLSIAILLGTRMFLRHGKLAALAVTAEMLFYVYVLAASPPVLAFLQSQRDQRQHP